MDIIKIINKIDALGLRNQLVNVNTIDGKVNTYYVGIDGSVKLLSETGKDAVVSVEDLVNVEHKQNYMTVYVETLNKRYTLLTQPTTNQKQWPNIIVDGDYIWVESTIDLSDFATLDDLIVPEDGEEVVLSEPFLTEDNKDFDLAIEQGHVVLVQGTDTEDKVIKFITPNDNWVSSIIPGSKFYKYDASSVYKISYDYFSANVGTAMNFRIGLLGYDKDGYVLNNLAYAYHEPEVFTLTQDYTSGDTKLYIDTTNLKLVRDSNYSILAFDKILSDGSTLWQSPEGTIHKNYSRIIAKMKMEFGPGYIVLDAPFKVDLKAGTKLKQGLEYINNDFGMATLPYTLDYNKNTGEAEWSYRETANIGNKLLQCLPIMFHNTDKFCIYLNITGCNDLEIKNFKITKGKKKDVVDTLTFSGSNNSRQFFREEELIYQMNYTANRPISTQDYIKADKNKIYELNFDVEYNLPPGWKISITALINSWNKKGHFLRTRESNFSVGRRMTLTKDLKKGDTIAEVDDSSVIIPTSNDLCHICYFHRQEDDFTFKGKHIITPAKFGYTDDKMEALINYNSLTEGTDKLKFYTAYRGRDMKVGDTITQGAPNNGYYNYCGGLSTITNKGVSTVNVGLLSGEIGINESTINRFSSKRNGPVIFGLGPNAVYMSFGLFADSLYDENLVRQRILPDGYYLRFKNISLKESKNDSIYRNLITNNEIYNTVDLNYDTTKPIRESRVGLRYYKDLAISNKLIAEIGPDGRYLFPISTKIINKDSLYKFKVKIKTKGSVGNRTLIRFQSFDRFGNPMYFSNVYHPDTTYDITFTRDADFNSSSRTVKIYTDKPFYGTKMPLAYLNSAGDFRTEYAHGIFSEDEFEYAQYYIYKKADSVLQSDGTYMTEVSGARLNTRVRAGSKATRYPANNTWLLDKTTPGIDVWETIETNYRSGITPNRSDIYKDGSCFLPGAVYFRVEILSNYRDINGRYRRDPEDITILKDFELIEIKPSHKDYDTIKSTI